MKEIFIIIRDTISEFIPEIKIIGAFSSLDAAMPTYKEEINEARRLANEMGYKIEESVGDLSFESYQEDYAFENHYNVYMKRVSLTDNRTAGEKMRDCRDVLKEIKTSGYIPFASPAPSSSERHIKTELLLSITHLATAVYRHEETYGKI